jgi:amidase
MSTLDRRALFSAAVAATAASAPLAARAKPLAASGEPDAVGLAALVRRKQISPLEALDAAIARIQRTNPKLNYLISERFEAARAQARTMDASLPFAGQPLLVKDLNGVIGLPTRDGVQMMQNAPVDTKQGLYFDRLTQAGFIPLGKTSTPEMGLSCTTEPLATGPTRNPWALDRSSGGSSGGAAAAVGSQAIPLAHGNDGGGSLRVPASACGVFALKPSRGLLVRDNPANPVIDYAYQNVISRSVRDSAAIMALTEAAPPAGAEQIGLVQPGGLKKLRVGVLTRSDVGQEPDPDVAVSITRTVKLLESMGHHVETASPAPLSADFIDDFLLFWGAGAGRTVAMARARLGRAPTTAELEPLTLALAAHSDTAGAAALNAAVERLKATGAAYNQWLGGYDVVLSPVLRTPPIRIGQLSPEVPFDTWVARVKDYMGYTPIHNISGAPAMSVPLHWTAGGLPVGVQFSAPPRGDGLLLKLAYALEEAKPWAHRRPPISA